MNNHVVIPFLGRVRETLRVAEAALRLGYVHLVDNGNPPEVAREVNAWRRQDVFHTLQTRLVRKEGTLDQAWNAALANVFFNTPGYSPHALVINNDIEFHPLTYLALRAVMQETGALFVSGVNVGRVPEQLPTVNELLRSPRGGPDYSCFLISIDCYVRFPFDPRFTYRGDIDHHRRIMLDGEGRRIFSVPVGYNHLEGGSKTIKEVPEAREKHAREDGKQGEYYLEKWGGGPNEETFDKPHGPDKSGYVSTPQLQRKVWGGWEPEP